MSQDIKPTIHELDIAFQGAYNQVQARGLTQLYLDNQDFFQLIQHFAEVIATERAYSDFLQEALNK